MSVILLLALATIVASQTQDQSLYVRLGSVFESICLGQVEKKELASRQALPGKMGAKGEPGSKGNKGDPGEADYSKVGTMISAKIQEVLDVQDRKIANLSNMLLEAKDEIRELKNKTRVIGQRFQNGTDYCPLKHEGKCFWVVYRINAHFNFEKGREICSSQGGTPANIYSENHMYIMMGYLRTFIGKHLNADVWLGMTYSQQTKTTSLSDGTKASFVKWYPNYPGSYCCNIVLRSRDSWNDKNQYMYVDSSTSLRMGVFCEKSSE